MGTRKGAPLREKLLLFFFLGLCLLRQKFKYPDRWASAPSSASSSSLSPSEISVSVLFFLFGYLKFGKFCYSGHQVPVNHSGAIKGLLWGCLMRWHFCYFVGNSRPRLGNCRYWRLLVCCVAVVLSRFSTHASNVTPELVLCTGAPGTDWTRNFTIICGPHDLIVGYVSLVGPEILWLHLVLWKTWMNIRATEVCCGQGV